MSKDKIYMGIHGFPPKKIATELMKVLNKACEELKYWLLNNHKKPVLASSSMECARQQYSKALFDMGFRSDRPIQNLLHSFLHCIWDQFH